MAPVNSAPTIKFTVLQLQRSITTIWKDDTSKPTQGTKPAIYQRVIDQQVIDPTETWSNCRAVRIKPGNPRCNYLVVVDDVVKGKTKEIMPEDEGKKIFYLCNFKPEKSLYDVTMT